MHAFATMHSYEYLQPLHVYSNGTGMHRYSRYQYYKLIYIYILEVFKAQILSSCLKVSISRGVALPCFQAGPTSLKELRGGGAVLWLSLHDTRHDTPFLSQPMPTACFHYQFCHGWAHPIPTPVQKWHARQVVLCNFETVSTRFMSICQSMIKYVK